MKVRNIPSAEFEMLLDPGATEWRAPSLERIDLVGAPLGMQPTDAIRVAWAGRKIGAVDRVDVAAAHDGQRLAFFLEWSDPDENREPQENDQFADAAAVVMPAVKGAPVVNPSKLSPYPS